MPIPPDPVLKAALRWLEHLPTSDISRTRVLFTSHGTFSDITPTQYAAAYTWLRDNGLLDSSVPSSQRKAAVFETAVSQTLWFTNADVLVQEPAAVPEDGLRLAAALGISDEEAFACIRESWAKVDAAERARVGAAGELALIELLAAIPEIEIRHVAAESDGYGYDISATARYLSLHLEVKTTTSRARLRIYLSRNEYETMLRDDAWILVAVRLDQELRPVALATIDREWIAGSAPVDRQPVARWASLRLDVSPDVLISGLPALVQEIPSHGVPILRGDPHWPG